MEIQPAVSLWNYTHYSQVADLEEILSTLKQNKFGVELWNSWQRDDGLYQKSNHRRIQKALDGMPVSLHAAIGENDPDFLTRQIEAAALWGAEILVIHADNISLKGSKDLDLTLANQIVEYGRSLRVQVALENGQLPVLKKALQEVEGLKICLDTGHVYLVEESMADFLEEFQADIVHLHLQETLSQGEQPLIGQEGIILDHYIPGTGGIPADDWNLLFRCLKEIDYQGMIVYEIQPRKPLQTAYLTNQFLKMNLGGSVLRNSEEDKMGLRHSE